MMEIPIVVYPWTRGPLVSLVGLVWPISLVNPAESKWHGTKEETRSCIMKMNISVVSSSLCSYL